MKQRFIEEVKALVKFSHAGIGRVYTFFEENNTAYMVMEFLRGKSLGSVVADTGPIQEVQAVDWIEQAGAALDAVHKAKMLHRDVKPDNLIVEDGGRVVLIDFGAAREFAAGKTRDMSVVLTPGYAPLEQYSKQGKFGPYTDIYALAATLYHLLTGVAPIPATDRANGVNLEPPEKLNKAISRSATDAILWAMEMRIDQRPQTVPQFLQALRGQTVPKRTASSTGSGSFPFKFKNAQAGSVADLAVLCDRYWDEAEDYLYQAYLEKWLAQIGEAALAQQARMVASTYKKEQRKGLEMFVREITKSAGLASLPALAAQPATLDFGKLPVGASTSKQLRLNNQSRGYAWGTIVLQPPIKGLTAPSKFEGSNAQIDLQLDLASATPGVFRSQLLVQPDGIPTALGVPIVVEVTGVSLQAKPSAIDLGQLVFGTATRTRVQLTAVPAGGRIIGSTSWETALPGAQCRSRIDGITPDVEISVDTGALEAGRTYSSTLRLDTNGGTIRVPIRFETAIDWTTVWKWSGGFALVGGLSLGLGRALLASASPAFDRWFLSYSSAPEALWTGGILAAILGAAGAFAVKSRRRK